MGTQHRFTVRRMACAILLCCVLWTTAARAEGIPCWAFCNCPPKTIGVTNLQPLLLKESNPQLNALARFSGFLTTYAGKLLGIRGWKNYHQSAQVNGIVTHASGSSDGLYTVDVRIIALQLGKLEVPDASGRFIRIEIFPRAKAHPAQKFLSGDSVCILGQLLWDADGFLEVHPETRSDISAQPCPASK